MTGEQELNKKCMDSIKNTLKNQPDYIRGFVDYMNDVAVKTRQVYMWYIISFMEYINKDVKDLTFDDFTSYLSHIEYKENGDETSPSYRIAVYSAMKKFCKYLYSTKRIKENYMIEISRPKFYEKQSTIEKRSIGYLNQKEINKYIDTVEFNYLSKKRQVGDDWNARDQAIIYVFLNTGIRCSALIKLNVSDVDFKNKTLIVTDKGNKVKVYDLSDQVLKILKVWIDIRKTKIDNDDEEALFISKRRSRITSLSVRKIVGKYAEYIDGKNITPHKLRATYGTQLYEATKDIYFVQECMGHNSPKTTELYVREKKENMKKASDIMSKIIK